MAAAAELRGNGEDAEPERERIAVDDDETADSVAACRLPRACDMDR